MHSSLSRSRLGRAAAMPARLLLAYVPAAAGGWLCSLINVPLAWLIGALLVTAGLNVAGLGLPVSTVGRRAGQVVLGCAIGLFFTPVTVAALVEHAGAMLFAGAFVLVVGCAAGLLLMRMSGIDWPTAYFASVPGGAAEMALMAQHHGGSGAPVAFAQALRVAILVTVIPPAVIWSGIAGEATFAARTGAAVDTLGLGAMLALAIVAGWLASRARLPNAWLLGPMTVVAAITGFDVGLSGIPSWMIYGSQVLLGTSLGAMFSRETLVGARGFLFATMVGNVLLIGICLGLALVGMLALDVPLASMILATAPGGVTEMSITAKALHLDVAMVSAFHVVRIFMIVPTTPLVFQGLHRVGLRLRDGRAGGD